MLPFDGYQRKQLWFVLINGTIMNEYDILNCTNACFPTRNALASIESFGNGLSHWRVAWQETSDAHCLSLSVDTRMMVGTIQRWLIEWKRYWIASQWFTSVGGVTVSMVAFQAADPGSTPGQRTVLFLLFLSFPEKSVCLYRNQQRFSCSSASPFLTLSRSKRSVHSISST